MPKHMSYEVNGVKFLLTEKEAKSYLFCLKCKQYEPFSNFLENLTNALKSRGRRDDNPRAYRNAAEHAEKARVRS